MRCNRAVNRATGRSASQSGSERTWRSLIEAAVEAFLRRGYEATSVRAIAQRAQAYPLSAFCYFGSKCGLHRRGPGDPFPIAGPAIHERVAVYRKRVGAEDYGWKAFGEEETQILDSALGENLRALYASRELRRDEL
jgi:AcrR family transcriptional regulator